MKKRIALLAALLIAGAMPGHAQDGLIAHEWGSLTQVQGTKGLALGGGRENLVELPPFVIRWSTVPMLSRVQETDKPILYLYTDRNRMVTVEARVPTGMYTEWWPPAQEFAPRKTHANQKITPRSGWIRWPNVAVLATKPARPAPRAAPKGSWYPILRETDAAWLRVRGQHYARAMFRGGGAFDELERFLLYRGVSDSRSAIELKVAHGKDGEVRLSNSGTLPLGKVLLIRSSGKAGWVMTVDSPAPGKASTVATKGAKQMLVADLEKAGTAAMVARLTAAGLYEKEARGMVRIWAPEWFREPGFRALYLIPRSKVDALLPLTIRPTPKKTVRVLVGRILSVTPERAEEIRTWIAQLGSSVWKKRDAAAKTIATLGRRAEPLLRAALKGETDPERAARIRDLLKLLDPTRRLKR